VRSLVEARDARELGWIQRRLDRVDLIILDELRFVPFDRAAGELLFGVSASRYEKRSVLLTTNLSFAEWPKVFGGDEKPTTALLESACSPRCRHHHQGEELPDAEAQPTERRGGFRPGDEDR
jgi:DNA replication protein DnaC